jgi:hypothetical protein
LQTAAELSHNLWMQGEVSNENRRREWVSAHRASDPQRHYVRDYLEKAVQHFLDCGIHLETINDGLAGEIVKLRPGDPFAIPADENALLSNLNLLWDVRHQIEPLIAQYERRLKRIEERRQASTDENVPS